MRFLNLKDLTTTSIGNILEWFDFGLFMFLAPLLGVKFFPVANAMTASLAAFGAFAAGYIFRPLGGILFGYIGDTRGRATALRLSILMISFSILAVGVLPTYHSIGIAAAILFTVFRITQGISAGGEYCGIMIYLAEISPPERRGVITSFAGSGATLGFLLASLCIIGLKTLIPTEALAAWGWRLPFIGMGGVGFVILYFRLKLTETPVYLGLKEHQVLKREPLRAAIRLAPKSLFTILGLTCMSSTFYLLFFGYMPVYLSRYTTAASKVALGLDSVMLLIMLFLIPVGGMLGDRFGRKNMLLLACLCMVIFAFPCFALIQLSSFLGVFLALLIAVVISSMDQGSNLSAFVENCPEAVRYSGIGFAYNLGNALFGGTVPLVADLLILKGGVYAPAFLVIAAACVSFFAILNLRSRKHNRLAM